MQMLQRASVWAIVLAFVSLALSLASLVSVADGSNRSVLQAQQILAELGYDPGPLDGLLGPSTRSALKQYQLDRGLPQTGELDEATAEALGVEPFISRGHVRPLEFVPIPGGERLRAFQMSMFA